ncbi:hypothetical protein C9374_003224 [Naegleria lovaniensis]|uniref:Endonuclease/exonuclease/phosphatase domain-containing protein n=1 Tax=Naegleria lovaniensis TaxID=51637 RepID=A0AA88GNN1_NAELO|nr:uncharacterized protein C9374_003224 [Naegleria lovaniensis]KAG2386075.1 hypothetical protein C9374_003224 [Naegleria lovaniensis]
MVLSSSSTGRRNETPSHHQQNISFDEIDEGLLSQFQQALQQNGTTSSSPRSIIDHDDHHPNPISSFLQFQMKKENEESCSFLIFLVFDLETNHFTPMNNFPSLARHLCYHENSVKQLIDTRVLELKKFGTTRIRMDYVRTTSSQQQGSTNHHDFLPWHGHVVILTKQYLQSSLIDAQSCMEMMRELAKRISFDLNYYQVKTLILFPLMFHSQLYEFKYWNKYGCKPEFWKDAFSTHLQTVQQCYVISQPGTTWDNRRNNFTVVTYNLLAQSYIRDKLYYYCNKEDLKENVRAQRILKQLQEIEGDILMFQEIESNVLRVVKNAVTDAFSIFEKKKDREEGLALVIDKMYWDVLDSGCYVLKLDEPQKMVYAICVHKKTKRKIIVATTHLIGDPQKLDVQAEQANSAINLLTFIREQHDFKSDIKCSAIIIGGDFNADVRSKCYSLFLNNGYKSSVKEIHGNELEITFNTNSIHKCIDFLFVKTCSPLGQQPQVDCNKSIHQPQIIIKENEFLPNQIHGSDHIPVYACFSVN